MIIAALAQLILTVVGPRLEVCESRPVVLTLADAEPHREGSDPSACARPTLQKH